MSLVHHVCKEAEGLESLFLISKSNCAFANFRDEQASVAAQRKLHDSKFLTVRLVSRLRKSTVEGPAGVTAPTGPAASTSHAEPVAEPATTDSARVAEKSTTTSALAAKTDNPGSPAEGATPSKDRFFVLKSLTVEDIELSVRTGIWATQSHNEETLNNAFRVSLWAPLPLSRWRSRRLTRVPTCRMRITFTLFFQQTNQANILAMLA